MRLRLTFSKDGALRYIGHLDLQQIWERTARRAGLPLAYTQGFHPSPKIQIACALPLGFSGRGELVDLWLKEDASFAGFHLPGGMAELLSRLRPACPPGLDVLAVEPVEERSPALQTQVAAAEYQALLLEPAADLPARVERLLAAEALPRERRGKPYDLRPLVHLLEVGEGSLRMVLAAREGATARPEEVLLAMDLPPTIARVERTRLLMKQEAA